MKRNDVGALSPFYSAKDLLRLCHKWKKLATITFVQLGMLIVQTYTFILDDINRSHNSTER